MRNQDSGFRSDRLRGGPRRDDDYQNKSVSRLSDDDMQDRGDWDRDYAARDRDWDQEGYRGRAWEQNDYGDIRGGRMNRGARWNEERNYGGGRRWSGESSYGQPIYGGGEFTGGYGWSGRQPSGNWRGEDSSGSDAYGYGRMGSADWRQPDEMADWDADYRHWRSQQLGKFDQDYHAWRSERRQKFADEFEKWRQGRSGNSGNLSSGGTSEPTMKEARK